MRIWQSLAILFMVFCLPARAELAWVAFGAESGASVFDLKSAVAVRRLARACRMSFSGRSDLLMESGAPVAVLLEDPRFSTIAIKLRGGLEIGTVPTKCLHPDSAVRDARSQLSAAYAEFVGETVIELLRRKARLTREEMRARFIDPSLESLFSVGLIEQVTLDLSVWEPLAQEVRSHVSPASRKRFAQALDSSWISAPVLERHGDTARRITSPGIGQLTLEYLARNLKEGNCDRAGQAIRLLSQLTVDRPEDFCLEAENAILFLHSLLYGPLTASACASAIERHAFLLASVGRWLPPLSNLFQEEQVFRAQWGIRLPTHDSAGRKIRIVLDPHSDGLNRWTVSIPPYGTIERLERPKKMPVLRWQKRDLPNSEALLSLWAGRWKGAGRSDR